MLSQGHSILAARPVSGWKVFFMIFETYWELVQKPTPVTLVVFSYFFAGAIIFLAAGFLAAGAGPAQPK